MQNSTNMRILELLQFLYERTDENHPATVSDIIAHLNEKGIQAVRQTVYADTNALIDAGIDIVVVKSTQNQYFMGSRLFEYPELKMLTDAVASSKIISAKKSEELVQKLCRLTSTHQAEQLRQLASLSSRVKPDNEQVYYIIDAIQTAILEKRQIQFQYYEYTPEKKRVLKHGGYLYQLDPYALEWKNDHYYHQLAASYLSQAPEDAALRPCGPVRTLCGPVRPQRRPCGNGPADRPAHGTGRGCQGCLGLKTATAVGADQRAAGNHGDLVPARRKERRRPVYRINREAEKNP